MTSQSAHTSFGSSRYRTIVKDFYIYLSLFSLSLSLHLHRTTRLCPQPALHSGLGLEQSGPDQRGTEWNLYVQPPVDILSLNSISDTEVLFYALIIVLRLFWRCSTVRQLFKLHRPSDFAIASAQPEDAGKSQHHLSLSADWSPGSDTERCSATSWFEARSQRRWFPRSVFVWRLFCSAGLVGLINKNLVSRLISQYAQVVVWFCRTGLLPEGSGRNTMKGDQSQTSQCKHFKYSSAHQQCESTPWWHHHVHRNLQYYEELLHRW